MFYLHWALQPWARVQLPTAHPERAVYVATGSADLDGTLL
jgi:redox-sensitive bicupin YhaK (pirin superfamily)